MSVVLFVLGGIIWFFVPLNGLLLNTLVGLTVSAISSFGFQVYLTRDHLPAKGSIDDIANITMPNTKRGVILEIEVNPSRNKPLNEVTYTNNKIRETIKNLDSDEREQTKESDPYLVK